MPKNLTDIRSWFGLINQVAGYGQLRKTLDPFRPFRPFLSPKVKFEWKNELQSAFKAGKLEKVKAIEKGAKIFDPCRHVILPLPEGMQLRRGRPGMLHEQLAHMLGSVAVQLRSRVQVRTHRRRGPSSGMGPGTDQVLYPGL